MSASRGVTLIDTIVGIALMLVVFAGISAAFQLSVDVVSNNKARAGAIALADERMEYIRSLSYSSIGTVGGVPSGTIPQSETTVYNGVTYTRRTVVEYEDDPGDGLAGSDTNGITEDYKAVKVDVAWTAHGTTRHFTIVSRVSPATGLESNPCSGPCGTLTVDVVNALSQAIAGATVTITNASTSPTINISTFTNASGTASVIGAPAAAGYMVSVTESGYSTDGTYNTSHPYQPPLTVSNNLTTSATFRIDVLSTKNLYTFTPIQSGGWTDAFSDASKIATSTNVTLSGGQASLSDPTAGGHIQSTEIIPNGLDAWSEASTTSTQPSGTSIAYRVYDGGGVALIPDTIIPGNSAGIPGPTIDLSGVSTTTYPALRLDATLTGNGVVSPSLDSWGIAYTYGPTPLPNVALSLTGAKWIDSGPPMTYKYNASLNSGAFAGITLSNMEWDTYTLSVATSTGYDLSSVCNPASEYVSGGTSQFALAPNTQTASNIYLLPHTTNSLWVDVVSGSALVSGATVILSSTGFSATSTTDSCGQSFFSGLSQGSAYTLAVGASGHATTTVSNVNVSGTSHVEVSIN